MARRDTYQGIKIDNQKWSCLFFMHLYKW
jgi:hypothetical protein